MKNKFRVFINTFDYFILNIVIFKIKEFSNRLKLNYSGPVFLPKKRERFNILRSPHVNKNSRDQYEIINYKVIFDFLNIEKYIVIFFKKLFKYFNINFYFKFII